LDNFSNISSEINFKNVRVFKGDIREKKDVEIVVSKSDIDIIIHTAAQINVDRSINDPIMDADNNINGTLNILDAVRRFDCEKFVYISSAAVYGRPIYTPIDEKHPTNPISPYGLSKLTGERYSMLYNELYGLQVTSVRLFNVFGFKNSDDIYSGVITNFISRIKENESPIIFGDGSQTRDFVYIDDIVGAISEILNNKKAEGEIFNIGTGKSIKISDLSKIIINIFNKKIEPEFIQAKIGDIKDSIADITKIKDKLNFELKYNLEEGLRHMLKN
jgi:UDP-glucose 4-epimerase